MARSIIQKPNTDAPDSDYPFGKIRDNDGSGNGTPVNAKVYGDIHQFFAKLMYNAGITANDLPDNEYSGFQLFQALINVINKNGDQDIIKGLKGSYSADDLIVLHGCVISATVPGSSTITAGAIFYNGIVYHVPAATVVTSGGQTLVFKIDTSEEPNFVYLTNGSSGSCIADYNGATVKLLSAKSTTAFISITPNSGALTINSQVLKYVILGGIVTVSFIINYEITSGSPTLFTCVVPSYLVPTEDDYTSVCLVNTGSSTNYYIKTVVSTSSLNIEAPDGAVLSIAAGRILKGSITYPIY